MRGVAIATRSSAGGPRPAGARDEMRDGDVLIRLESSPPERYSLRQLPAKAQFTMTARVEAERLGNAFAAEHHVNLWYTDGHTWELLQRFERDEPR